MAILQRISTQALLRSQFFGKSLPHVYLMSSKLEVQAHNSTVFRSKPRF